MFLLILSALILPIGFCDKHSQRPYLSHNKIPPTVCLLFIADLKKSTRTSCMRWQGPGCQKSRIQMSPVLINCNGQRSNQHQRSLNRNFQAELQGISANRNRTEFLLVGRQEVSCKTV
jgi:hypothetical protein